MIDVQHVTKAFETRKGAKTAVSDISFKVGKGDILGFIGRNGAGKSTTIKMLCGILTPTTGNITVNGIIPYKKRRENGFNIGVVFGQKTQLWWDLPLKDSYDILRRIYKVSKEDYYARLEYFNSVFGIYSLLDKQVRVMSLGEKMKAEITASLLHNPKVLFLDEPTIGLDFIAKQNMRNAIKEINQKYKTTIIITTHDLDDIEALCSKLIIIDNGSIIYNGDYQSLIMKYGRGKSISLLFESDDSKILYAKCLTDTWGGDVIHESSKGKLKLVSNNLDLIRKVCTDLNANYGIRDVMIENETLEQVVEKIYCGL